MKLNVKGRVSTKKSSIKQSRREGEIPAVLYAKGKSSETIMVDNAEFGAALRKIKSGMLPTTVFEIASPSRTLRAIVKDIQYHPTTYQVLHLDFQELVDGQKVTVKVPVECIGVADCTGIKLGGFLRQVVRFVTVECLPKDIPTMFTIDVKDLNVFQSKRLSDIPSPKGVRVIGEKNEVIAVIAKK